MKTLFYYFLGLLFPLLCMSGCQRRLEVEINIPTNYQNISFSPTFLFLDTEVQNRVTKDSVIDDFSTNFQTRVYQAGRSTIKRTFNSSSYYSVITLVSFYDYESGKSTIFYDYRNGEVPYTFLFFPLPKVFFVTTNGFRYFP